MTSGALVLPPHFNTVATLPCEMQQLRLAVYNNEFIVGSACCLRKSLGEYKIIENMLLILNINHEQVPVYQKIYR